MKESLKKRVYISGRSKKQPPKAEEKAVVQSIEIKIPAKITEILISRMEELEELIEELTNEHKEIRNFLGMEMR